MPHQEAQQHPFTQIIMKSHHVSLTGFASPPLGHHCDPEWCSVPQQHWQMVCVCVLNCSVVSDSLWPLHCSPPGSSVYEILQARILAWVAMPSSSVYLIPAHIYASKRGTRSHWQSTKLPLPAWENGRAEGVTNCLSAIVPRVSWGHSSGDEKRG